MKKQKNFLRRLKNEKKVLIKRDMKYFIYEPTALVSKL